MGDEMKIDFINNKACFKEDDISVTVLITKSKNVYVFMHLFGDFFPYPLLGNFLFKDVIKEGV